MTLSIETRQLILGLALVLLVTTLGMVLALQGWKSRVPAFDMLTYFNSAEHLLKTGTPAQYGDVSSYGSFSPPGTTWLMAPGMLVLNDPRLYEKLGSGLLYLGTLLGVFLLARAVLGIWCAYLSVVVYGLSGLGLSLAGSLWPIGHPFFYIWMVYWSIQWVSRNDARYLAAAILTWTFGMYDDMAITPAFFILPVIWFLYHPQVFSRMLIVASVLTLAVWFPYLQFEASRGFADLQSQFLLHNIFPSNYSSAWCDPNLNLNKLNDPSTPATLDSTISQSASPSILVRVLTRAHTILSGLLADLNEVAPLPAISIVLLLPLLSSVVVLGASSTRIARFLAPGRVIPVWITTSGNPQQNFEQERKTELLLLSLLVPCIILLVVAEADRPERFFWMWPLQAIFLAAFFTNILRRLQMPSLSLWLSQLLLISAMLINPMQAHLGSWRRDGWAGVDPEQVQVVDFVASQLQAEGKDRAAIGYQIYIYEFMPKYHILDPQYKVGAEFDFLFKHQHQISNTNTCAEGLSPIDEYRIVQTKLEDAEGAPRQYFNVQTDDSFTMVRQFGSYQVLRRDQNKVMAKTW